MAIGLFDQWFGRNKTRESLETPQKTRLDIIVGADTSKAETRETFSDKNITFSGDLTTYDYDNILRNKQKNIVSLFELSDYFVDADPIYRGIIKEVYTPFSVADDFKLVGANEKVKKKYFEYYDRIHLKDLMSSIFLQFYKYGNVYCYLMKDGSIITLPVHQVRVANVMINGEPVIELNCRSIKDDLAPQGVKAKKDYIEDDELDVRLQGFPEEVATAIKEGKEYVQLNPENTFVLQDLKEDWARYAIPMVATCLRSFAKKEVISNYENSLLNLGARSFVHVRYGDEKNEVIPDTGALRQVYNIFRQAMTGSALAVTNNWCHAEVIQPKTDDVFEHDKYKGVNADILSAGGISGVIVSGRSEDGSTFASAQVSMQTAAIRIKRAKDDFCEMMNKINKRLNGSSSAMPHSAEEHVPKFTFPPVDLSGNKAFQEACLRLWEKGVLSNETLLQTYGYDIGQEVERMRTEQKEGTSVIYPKGNRAAFDTGKKSGDDNGNGNGEGEVGRPEMSDEERTSDPAKAQSGRQPKPSNPEGSLE